jgi:hypothetical protein
MLLQHVNIWPSQARVPTFEMGPRLSAGGIDASGVDELLKVAMLSLNRPRARPRKIGQTSPVLDELPSLPSECNTLSAREAIKSERAMTENEVKVQTWKSVACNCVHPSSQYLGPAQ